ncbi:MAG: hypothetical protein QW165_01395 [Candidatus Woesearchaeota archaeon]
MAEIPWWVWTGVGLFVAISAAFSGGKLTLFAWVGLLFIAIGIGKIVYLFVAKEKSSPKEQRIVHPPHVQPVMPQGHFCPRCRVTVMPTDHFCRYCGTRLR